MGRHAAGESSGRATGDPHRWRAASRNRRNERRWVCRAVGFTGIGGGGGAAPPPLSRRRVDARDGMRTPSLGVAVWRRASAAARPSRYTPRGHGRGALRSRRSAWRPRRRATTDAHIGPVPVRQQLLRPVLLARPGRRPRIDCPFAFRRVKKPKADENTTFFPHRPTAPRASPFHRPTENTGTAAGGGSTGRAATAATPWTPTPCPFFPPLRSAERPTRVRGDRGGRPAGRLANPLPRHPPAPPLSPPPARVPPGSASESGGRAASGSGRPRPARILAGHRARLRHPRHAARRLPGSARRLASAAGPAAAAAAPADAPGRPTPRRLARRGGRRGARRSGGGRPPTGHPPPPAPRGGADVRVAAAAAAGGRLAHAGGDGRGGRQSNGKKRTRSGGGACGRRLAEARRKCRGTSGSSLGSPGGRSAARGEAGKGAPHGGGGRARRRVGVRGVAPATGAAAAGPPWRRRVSLATAWSSSPRGLLATRCPPHTIGLAPVRPHRRPLCPPALRATPPTHMQPPRLWATRGRVSTCPLVRPPHPPLSVAPTQAQKCERAISRRVQSCPLRDTRVSPISCLTAVPSLPVCPPFPVRPAASESARSHRSPAEPILFPCLSPRLLSAQSAGESRGSPTAAGRCTNTVAVLAARACHPSRVGLTTRIS